MLNFKPTILLNVCVIVPEEKTSGSTPELSTGPDKSLAGWKKLPPEKLAPLEIALSDTVEDEAKE